MTRWKAAGIHFSISLMIGIAAFCLLYFVYYPQPYFVAAGASVLVLLLLGVDVVLGPLLTLVVFKTGKKSLKFDLGIIATVQTTALIYGLHIMWEARPVYLVAAIDRFALVSATDLDAKDIASAKFPEYAQMPSFGPKLVGVVRPENPDDQFALAQSGMAGKDIERMPRYYIPYALASEALLQRAKPLALLQPKNSEAQALITQWLVGRSARDSYAYLPLTGARFDAAVILERDSRLPVAILPIDAW